MGGHGPLGDTRLNAITTYLPGFTYSTVRLTNSKQHACGHASAPRELQDCRMIFCKQTCFSRSYFWDRKLSCKVASLQWASLVDYYLPMLSPMKAIMRQGSQCKELDQFVNHGNQLRSNFFQGQRVWSLESQRGARCICVPTPEPRQN